MQTSQSRKQGTGSFKRITTSLYWRISRTFLLLIFLAAILLGLTINYSLISFDALVDQRLNWELAQDLRRELRPLLESPNQKQELEKKIFLFSQLNPRIEIFLLDADGNVLLGNPPSYRRVRISTDPLDHFSSVKGYPPAAIRGSIPQLPDETAPFSVAPVSIFGQPGYLYVMLRGSRYRVAWESLGDVEIFKISAVLFLVTFSVIALLGLLFFFLITKRFGQMTRVLQAFRDGDYSQRIEQEGADEIGLHARAFNEMADTVVEQMELVRKNDSLRRELISNVSHDLRRPLAAMHSLLELILSQSEELEAEKKENFLRRALANCEGLRQLVNDLFELSKLDAEDHRIQAEKFAVDELAECVIEDLAPLAEKTSVSLSLKAPEKVPYVMGDPMLIERALLNLVENAIRYTPQKGTVELTLSIEQARVRITVRDTGIGIPETELENIFDRFYRTNAALEHDHEGSGLGLPITKKIVEAHGETLEVSSTAGEGSRFWFSLPLAGG